MEFFLCILQLNYDFKRGTTAVLKSRIHKLIISETVQPIVPSGSGVTAMDTA